MNTLSEKAERFSLLPLLPTHPPLKHLKSPQIERAWCGTSKRYILLLTKSPLDQKLASPNKRFSWQHFSPTNDIRFEDKIAITKKRQPTKAMLLNTAIWNRMSFNDDYQK